MEKIEIIEIKENNSLFSHFLKNHPHLIFHTFSYKKFIEEAFNTKYKILAVTENNEIKLILPLVEVKSRLFGNKVISSAYLEYGGPAGDEKYLSQLIDYLNTQYQKNFQYLEIRGGSDNFDNVLSQKLIKKNLYKRFVLKLTSEAEVWKNIQHSKRKAINKALRDLEVKEVPFSDLNAFYHLYCQNMKRFGSPSYSKKYFISFYKNILGSGLGKIYGSYHQGKLVSALVGFCYQDRVHILIAVSNEKYREFRPNDAMHWKFIQWACQNKYSWFDFGRVREDSGQFEYKQKWGPELKDLPSYFLLWQAKEIPVVDPSQKKYRAALKLWQKLPLGVTKMLGHKLRKGLGI